MDILVVDGEPRAAAALADALAALGHRASVAGDGRAALAAASEGRFEAILLEMALPHVDGASVVRLLRERGLDTPIVMVSALGDLEHRLAGLAAGADDYLVKPAAPLEIDARLQAILRRGDRPGRSGVLHAGAIEINEIKHRVTRGGRLIVLPNVEYRVLCELARNVDAVVTRAMLYRRVWNYEIEPTTKIVDTVIRRLRAQIIAPGEGDPIITMRGIGYMLSSQA